MRIFGLLLGLIGLTGTASASELEPAELVRYYDSSDFSVQMVYRMEFGASENMALARKSIGLKIHNERANARGAPALFRAAFGTQGVETLAINGVDLRGSLLSASQAEADGFFGALTPGQFVTLVGGVIFAGSFIYEAAVDDDDASDVTGTGGS